MEKRVYLSQGERIEVMLAVFRLRESRNIKASRVSDLLVEIRECIGLRDSEQTWRNILRVLEKRGLMGEGELPSHYVLTDAGKSEADRVWREKGKSVFSAFQSKIVRPAYQNALTQYLKEIGRIPVMYWDEQKLNFQQRDEALACGDTAGAEEIKKRIWEGNLRFVVSMAIQIYGGCRDLLPLIVAGNDGLLKAIEKFRLEIAEDKGTKFLSYAVHGIRQEMQKEAALRGVQGVVRIPLNRFQQFRKIRRAESALEQRGGDRVTPEILAESLGVPLEVLKQFKLETLHGISLDDPGEDEGNGNHTPFRIIPDRTIPPPDHDLSDHLLFEEVSRVLATLPEPEAEAIIGYFGLNGGDQKTLQEMGDADKKTKQTFQQRKNAGLKRLRHTSRVERLRPFFDEE